jgi:ankyrin repeat protein
MRYPWLSFSCHEELVNSTINAFGAAHEEYSNFKMDEEPLTALGRAIRNGKEAMAKFLLSAGAEVDYCDSRGQTHLFYAVRDCDVSTVKLLLQHGATVDFIDSEGRTPLLWAIDPLNAASHGMPPSIAEKALRYNSRSKRLEQWREKTLPIVVLLLLDAGATIDHRDLNGRSPLSYAAQRRYDQVIRVLCDHGSDVNLEDRNGRTPFSWAAEGYWSLPTRAYMSNSSGTAILKDLLDNGADINLCDNYGRSPLWWAATNPENQEAKNLLLERNAVFNLSMPQTQLSAPTKPSCHDLFMFYQDKTGLIPLIRGLRGNSNDLKGFSWVTLNKFLLQGFDINTKLENGRTLLSWAVNSPYLTKVLEEGANPNISDLDGRTPLFWEVAERTPESVVSALEKYGAVVDFRDNIGRTPLSWLASQTQASPKVAHTFLKHGANPHCADNHGRSPLWYAETSKNEELVRVLKMATQEERTFLPAIAASTAGFEFVD